MTLRPRAVGILFNGKNEVLLMLRRKGKKDLYGSFQYPLLLHQRPEGARAIQRRVGVSSWIMDHLHPCVVVSHMKANGQAEPASLQDLEILARKFPKLPEDYLDIMQVSDTPVFHCDSQTKPELPGLHIEFHPPLDVHDWDEWYEFLKEDMPNCFFFATDGGPTIFFLGDFVDKPGVWQVHRESMDWKMAEFVAPSIRALLCEGIGWEKLAG